MIITTAGVNLVLTFDSNKDGSLRIVTRMSIKNRNRSGHININALSLISNIAQGMNQLSPVLQNIFDNPSMSTCNLESHGNRSKSKNTKHGKHSKYTGASTSSENTDTNDHSHTNYSTNTSHFFHENINNNNINNLALHIDNNVNTVWQNHQRIGTMDKINNHKNLIMKSNTSNVGQYYYDDQ